MARPVVLLCLFIFSSTFGVGAFPVLLPEIGASAHVGDFLLGAITGAFGLARLVADVPAGLFITHRLRLALIFAAVSIPAGVLCMGAGGPPWLLVVGRLLWGAGHAFAMIGGITAIVRSASPERRAISLNAYEMSGMLGVLCGMVAAGLLPRAWPWHHTLLVASSPQLLGIVLLGPMLRSLPGDVAAQPSASPRDAPAAGSGSRMRISAPTVLALSAGAAMAVAWSAVGQFALPLRGSREFELERSGVSLLVAVPQLADVALLLPVGAIADRWSRTHVLGWVLVAFSVGVVAVAFGSLPVALFGCALFGLGLAAWMLPVSLLNAGAAPGGVAWRTALYRTAVDAGIFVGPLLGGTLLSFSLLGPFCVAIALVLAGLGVALLRMRG